ELRAEPYWKNKIKHCVNVEVILETNVVEILGKDHLQKVKLDKKFNDQAELALNGLFIEAGSEPNIEYARGLGVETDEKGYIKIGSDGATSVVGVWAAGDITDGSDGFQQVITAAAEGAIAVRNIFKWLKK
ncbi:MAG: FAD-dependent oxidoreductase, partial [Parcubacteria group bacterium]